MEPAVVLPAVVLIVEDEPIIRMNAVDMVEEAGCIAIEAANADEAIAILESRNDICVVFTDINMPGSMDGLKLARAVHDRWPPIHLIVTSGMVTPDAGDIPDDGRFFRKPYQAEQIASALHAFAA
jgi:CheY-like chemotaxis protein